MKITFKEYCINGLKDGGYTTLPVLLSGIIYILLLLYNIDFLLIGVLIFISGVIISFLLILKWDYDKTIEIENM